MVPWGGLEPPELRFSSCKLLIVNYLHSWTIPKPWDIFISFRLLPSSLYTFPKQFLILVSSAIILGRLSPRPSQNLIAFHLENFFSNALSFSLTCWLLKSYKVEYVCHFVTRALFFFNQHMVFKPILWTLYFVHNFNISYF